MTVEMTPVKSSNLKALGYDAVARELHVEFSNGGRYVHHDVPADIHAALMAAESKGSYFHHNVRSKFPHRKPDPEKS